MRLAILSSRFPYPLERGDKLRLYYQIKELSKRHEVFLYALSEEDIQPEHIKEVAQFCKKLTIVKSSFLQKLYGCFQALFTGWPMQTGLSYSSRLHKTFMHDIREEGIDAVYCQLIRMAPYAMPVRIRKILDYMDAFGVSMQKRSNLVSFPLKFLYRWEAGRVERFENYLSAVFDACTIITEEDAKLIDLPDSKITIVPNGIDTNFFSNDGSTTPIYDVGYIGNLGYLPNIGAAEFLAKQILPDYNRKYGRHLSCLISGARPAPAVSSLSGEFITIRPWLDDIRASYRDIAILVAPIFYGTGQQNKVLEAMSMGIPVVCSGEVARGVKAGHREHLLIAENASEFSACIHDLISDPKLRNDLCRAARIHAEQSFSWEKQGELLDKILNTRDIVR